MNSFGHYSTEQDHSIDNWEYKYYIYKRASIVGDTIDTDKEDSGILPLHWMGRGKSSANMLWEHLLQSLRKPEYNKIGKYYNHDLINKLYVM